MTAEIGRLPVDSDPMLPLRTPRRIMPSSASDHLRGPRESRDAVLSDVIGVPSRRSHLHHTRSSVAGFDPGPELIHSTFP